MAIDTANKRFSAMLLGMPWRGINCFPSGTVDGAARRALAYLYSGILASGAAAVRRCSLLLTKVGNR